MGLDTTHDCWHGPYSAFNRFREAVKAAAKEHCDYEPDYDAHPFRAYMGWWDLEAHEFEKEADHHPYTHILDVFFIHSDCDGWIFPHHAEPLADALDALTGYLDDDSPYPNSTDRACLRQFVAGLRDAADKWEVITFR